MNKSFVFSILYLMTFTCLFSHEGHKEMEKQETVGKNNKESIHPAQEDQSTVNQFDCNSCFGNHHSFYPRALWNKKVVLFLPYSSISSDKYHRISRRRNDIWAVPYVSPYSLVLRLINSLK